MSVAKRTGRGAAKSALLASSVLTAASALMAPALAQVDEIIVSSQRRSENLQDVPISILALGTEKLEELEVTAFDDYAKFFPSVTFQSTGPNSTTVYMRGVVSGGDGNHSASLPSVGVYFDEQPVTTILGFLPLHIYDIERVEAIAGPQGTLYGASAQSGVLRIITNKPDASGFSAGYDVEVNAVQNGDIGYTAEGFVNQPLSDNAAIRLVGYYRKDAGYIDNVLGGRVFPTSGIGKTNAALVEDNFNDIETYGARAALKVDLSENWTGTLSLLGQESKANGVNFFDPDAGDLAISRFEPEFNNDRFGQAALTLEGKLGNFDVVYSGAYLKRQIESNSDYTDYAYYYELLYQNDGDPTTNFGAYFYDNVGDLIDPTQFYQGDDNFGKYSNEIRISTPQENRLRGVFGFFQNRQRHNIRQQYIVRDLADALEVTGEADTIWLTQQIRVDRDLAVFGELYYDLTDRLTFTGGVRGYRYKNSLQGFFGYGAGFSGSTGESQCFGPAIVPNSPCTNLDRTVKETGITYKLNLTYELDDSKLVYATYSTGFRPGGVNRRGTLPPYLEDTLVNYEVGFKSAWAENTFVLNGAFFWQQWKDLQFPILGQNGLTEIQNAAQARILGFEADLTWQPTDRFSLNGAVSVIDGQLTDNFCGFVDVNFQPVTDCPQAIDDPATDGDETGIPEAPDGQRLPVVPSFKGTMTARYEHPIGALTGHLQGSLSGQTSSPSNLLVADQAIIGDQEGFVIVDFSFGLRGEAWQLVGYINNAFDERPDQFSFVACAIGTCGQNGPGGLTNGINQGTAQPRTFGIRFGQDF
ncbi:MAG: TonB-dependent receptor [Parvularculaceae bacterium]|nr:TonB-dependent receptor [Parvularculaceae bacterium]